MTETLLWAGVCVGLLVALVWCIVLTSLSNWNYEAVERLDDKVKERTKNAFVFSICNGDGCNLVVGEFSRSGYCPFCYPVFKKNAKNFPHRQV